MTDVSAAKLGGMTVESEPVMTAQPPQLRGMPHITPSPTGQGVDVFSAVEANAVRYARLYAASFLEVREAGGALWYWASVGKAALFLSAQPAPTEVFSQQGGVELILGLGPGLEVVDPGDVSTSITPINVPGSGRGLAYLILEGEVLSRSYFPVVPSLEDSFEIKDRARVSAFLNSHPFLKTIISEGEDRIRTIFGTEPQLALELLCDPDSGNEDELFIIIRTHCSQELAQRNLQRLDHDWWLNASQNTQSRLNIDIEVR